MGGFMIDGKKSEDVVVVGCPVVSFFHHRIILSCLTYDAWTVYRKQRFRNPKIVRKHTKQDNYSIFF